MFTLKQIPFMVATGLLILGIFLVAGSAKVVGIIAIVLAAVCVAGGMASMRANRSRP
ncbi:MAG: hypothetical protein JOZ07_06975 [Solirubrobacterales bacterium]|nr:hypothetical protein [Solirubrobacterales bacterium]